MNKTFKACTMMTHYLAVAGVLAILLGAGFSVGMMLLPVPGVTKVNFDRIQVGITYADVEAIFGRSPDAKIHYVGMAGEPDGYRAVWDERSINHWAVVVFDEEGRFFEKDWEGPGRNEAFIEKIRRWLRL